jgi:hypothetical protein
MKVHTTTIMTPQGPGELTVPDEAMKICPCGCEFFRVVNRVTYVIPRQSPGPVLLQQKQPEPVPIRFDVHVCDKCGRELLVDHQTKKDVGGWENGRYTPDDDGG